MKYWQLHELHKNAVKNVPYEHMPKNVEILNFEQLLKHIKFLRVCPSMGGGGKFNSVGLDRSGSQPFNEAICSNVSVSVSIPLQCRMGMRHV